MADSEALHSEPLEKSFKCCTKKVVKITVCVKCGSVYHKSCIERRNYISIDEVRIICCQEGDKDCDKNGYSEEMLKRYEQEVHYLLQLITEKDEKYNILLQNNQLLHEKLKYLETNKKQKTETSKTPVEQSADKETKNVEINNDTKTNQIVSKKSVNNNNTHKTAQPSRRNVGYKPQIQDRLDNASTVNYTSILEKAQQHVMQDVINLATDKDVEENRWQTVQNKRRRTTKGNIGQFTESTGKFKGLKPKVWMFLYRVNGDVEEPDIEGYLKERTGQKDEEFLVKYIRSTRNNFKCFKVAADFRFKEDFYSPTFWPSGVGYRRFDFKRDELQFQQKENVQPQPSSFLGVTTT